MIFSSFSHLFSNLGLISSRKEVQVGQEGAGLHHLLVPGLCPLLAKRDVVSQRAVLDPGLLRNIGHQPLRQQEQQQPQEGNKYSQSDVQFKKNHHLKNYILVKVKVLFLLLYLGESKKV